MKNKKYPLEYKDKLGRVVYVLDSEFDRTIYKYWFNTNRLKIKYKYFREDVSFSAFSFAGKLILSSYKDAKSAELYFKYDGTIHFNVNPEKLKLINSIK